MSFQEMIRAIPYLSIRERKVLLKLIVDSLSDEKHKYDLPNFDSLDDEAGDTEPQEYINPLRDEQDDD